MATIRIEYDYVSAKAKEVDAKAGQIEQTLKSLVDDVETNINASTWIGTSADRFKAVWNQYSGEFNSFIQFLKSIQSKVETAATESRYYDQMQKK